jgi:hypothetical protein
LAGHCSIAGVDINEAVRQACLWLPEAEEFLSHGSPNFRVRGKTFATYVVNHHGDGRVALWLPALPGAQQMLIRAAPKHFFVPPYVGVRGWVGVLLDSGVGWKRVIELVREAYVKVAPRDLVARIGKPPLLPAAAKKLPAAQIDPFKTRRAMAVLKGVRKICAELPDTSEASQFGHPAWRAGKKTFVIARFQGGRLTLCFWVGIEQQGLMTQDRRFQIPPYMGHNGWIALDVEGDCDWREIENLSLQSYRHFALKRMLLKLAAP